MKLIDTHLHVNYKNLSVDGIIKYCDANDIEQCWVLTWEEQSSVNPNGYTHLSVEEVYSAFRQYPSRIVPMYAPDPRRHDVVNHLKDWCKKGIRGLGELKVSLNWDSDYISKILKVASDYGLPIIFHMQEEEIYFRAPDGRSSNRLLCRVLNRLTRHCLLNHRGAKYLSRKIGFIGKVTGCFPGYMLDFSSLETRLDEFPEVVFVGHGPLFWKGISSRPEYGAYPRGAIIKGGIICRLLCEKKNLYADLSGFSGYNAIARDVNFSRSFVSRFSNRLLYGTDNVSLGLKTLLDGLNLEIACYENIYNQNAVRILRGCPG